MASLAGAGCLDTVERVSIADHLSRFDVDLPAAASSVETV